MADGATNNRIEAIRSVLTLEALYEEASNICLKWVTERTRSRGRAASRRVHFRRWR